MLKQRLRELRKELHRTQGDLAQALHVSLTAYSYYEIGLRTPSIQIIRQLAEYYSVSMDYLYGRTDSRIFLPVTDQNESLLLDHFRAADHRGQDSILHAAHHEQIRHQRLSALAVRRRMEAEAKRDQPKNPFLNNDLINRRNDK